MGRIGLLAIPTALAAKAKELISSSVVKSTLRTDLDKIFFYSWKAGTFETGPTKTVQDGAPPSAVAKAESLNTRLILNYGPRESVAYTAVQFPRSYAAISAILSRSRDRLFQGEINTITDFACGTSGSVYAVNRV